MYKNLCRIILYIKLLLNVLYFEYNDCDQDSVTPIDDVNGDGLGGLFYLYNQCLGDVNVRLYLMTNMGHEWPTDNGQNDIVAANEIWYFLKDFDVNGKIIP